MAIIVNTNITALRSQKNLNSATNSMNTALERMSTGLRINSAKDDAAGLFVATGLETQIRGSKVAQDNIATGANVLQTMEGDLDVILDNLYRIRDLANQAGNSIYSEESMNALKDETVQRLDEIDRISRASNFNGLSLLDNSGEAGDNKLFDEGLRLQVGANADAAANSITLSKDVFFNDSVNSDTLGADVEDAGDKMVGEGLRGNVDAAFASSSAAAQYVNVIDAAINSISSKKASIGATQNRLEAAEASLTTTIENATAAKSTIMDADMAEEAAEFTKAQILQQTSSALLKQANALPQIAISLIQ